MSTRENKALIGTWVDEDLRDEFKIWCLRNKTSMSKFLEAFIRSKLGDPEKLQQIEKAIKRKS